MFDQKYLIDKNKKVTDPFPLIVQENFLEKKFFSDLAKSFPDNFFYDMSKKKSFRKSIYFNESEFLNFINSNQSWKQLYDLFKSDKFLKEILNFFETDYDKYNFNKKLENIKFYEKIEFKNNIKKPNYFEKAKINLLKIKNKFNSKLNLEIQFQCCQSSKGYSIVPHTDHRSKIVVFLFYMNDMKGSSSLNLYKLNKNSNNNWEQSPDINNLDIAKTIKVEKNKLVLFANTPNSYHAVEVVENESKRNFLYGSIALKGQRPWNY